MAPGLSPEERVAELREWSPQAAEAFRSAAAEFGIELDYSDVLPAGVDRLGRLFL
jgi:hypothetical protein